MFQVCKPGFQHCQVIRCDTGELAKDESVLIRVKSRVWIQTLLDVGIAN